MRKYNFKFFYLCFIGILAVLSIICLLHVRSVLKEYESSQPERRVEEQMEKLKSAANDGSLASAMNLEGLSEEEISNLNNRLAAEDLSLKLLKNAEGGEELVYTILSGEDRLADVSLTGESGKTKLLLFTMSEWTVTEVSAAVYEYDLTLPVSLSVLVSGEPITGEKTGEKIEYHIRSLSRPDVLISDALGESTVYDGKNEMSITEYVIQIPSNFTIVSSAGTPVSAELAETEAIDDYKYVAQYTEMPSTATYRLGLLSESPQFIIKDNLGNNADYTLDGHTVKLTDQASLPDIPSEMYREEDVLAHARTWSLFMTADLGGANYGYGKVEDFLLPDSYLREVAYNWATGVDITFTSVHTLDNPPFYGESVSGYVKYSDECFSCDVQLSKVMHLNSGDDVTDSMNCRFYYVLQDGIWYVADIQEIIG